ncbi:hypothetical protein [Lentilactobacillus parabuchneri]|nr:hypothetical protein [Lentilactobacillus parabuchneri]
MSLLIINRGDFIMIKRRVFLKSFGIAIVVGGALIFSSQPANASKSIDETVRANNPEVVLGHGKAEGQSETQSISNIKKASDPNATQTKKKVMSQKELKKTLKRIKAPSKKQVRQKLAKKVGAKKAKGMKTVYVLSTKKTKKSQSKKQVIKSSNKSNAKKTGNIN